MQREAEVGLEAGDVDVSRGAGEAEGEGAATLDTRLGGTGVGLEQGRGEEQAGEEGLHLLDDEGGGLGLACADKQVAAECLCVLTTRSPSSSSSATWGRVGRARLSGSLMYPAEDLGCEATGVAFGLPLAALARWTEVERLPLRRREGRPSPSPAASPVFALTLADAALARTAAAGRQNEFSLLELMRACGIWS